MGMNVTTEALIASAQRRAFMPSTGGAVSATEWLSILNETLFDYCVPFVVERRKGYFLAYEDVTLVSGAADYAIQSRAAGARFYGIQLLDSSGNPATPMLTPMEVEDAIAWPTSVLTGGSPAQYAVYGNQIHLVPTPSTPNATPTMRVYYQRRPSTLVLVASVMSVSGYPIGIGAPAGTFRVSVSGAVPSTFVVGASVELVRSVSGFQTDGPFPIAATGSGYFDVTGTLPTTASTTDKLCISETANVVTNFPEDWAWWLAQAAACEALAGRGDDSKLQRAEAKKAQLEAAIASQLLSRDVSGRHKMKNGQDRFGNRVVPFWFR